MLSHATCRRDILRSRRPNARGRWLQRLVRPGGRPQTIPRMCNSEYQTSSIHLVENFNNVSVPEWECESSVFRRGTRMKHIHSPLNSSTSPHSREAHVSKPRKSTSSADRVRSNCAGRQRNIPGVFHFAPHIHSNSTSVLLRRIEGHTASQEQPGTSQTGVEDGFHAERLMLSHGYGWHDLLRSRRHDSRSRWLQRLVRPVLARTSTRGFASI
jgi:hypothetical protein